MASLSIMFVRLASLYQVKVAVAAPVAVIGVMSAIVQKVAPTATGAAGMVFTVTATCSVSVQPLASVTVTV